jgi:hypothetical protein
MLKDFINSIVPNSNPYQQPQNTQPQQSAANGQAPASQPQQPTVQPNHFYISQDLKFGRESFSVTDGQTLVCVAKRKIMAVKEHMDVYRDEAATQIVFTIQQERVMAMSKVYDVISADGQKMGGYKLQAMQSMMKEHWDILDANDNPIGVIDQDMNTAMTGKAVNAVAGVLGGLFGGGEGAAGGMAAGSGLGNMIPQTFVASINNQPVCRYHEQMNIGVMFKMDIDFSGDTAGVFDRTLGIAGAILLASKHMTQDN